MIHIKDQQCTLDNTGTCIDCGVFHGDKCLFCGARGYHAIGCASGITGQVTPLDTTAEYEKTMSIVHQKNWREKSLSAVMKKINELNAVKILLLKLEDNTDPDVQREILSLISAKHDYLNF